MRLRTFSNILTLVLSTICGLTFFFNTVNSVSAAAPHAEAPAIVNQSQENIDGSVDNKKINENLVITPAPNLDQSILRDLILRYNRSDYFYPYSEELDIRIGVVLGVADSSDDKDFVNYIFGFNYLLPLTANTRWSVGVDLSTVGNGHLHFAKRRIYNDKGAFRPFYELGIMHKIVPDEKFASLSNVENYLLWGAVGFSNTQLPSRSVQYQLQAALGAKDFLIIMTCGYAWGF